MKKKFVKEDKLRVYWNNRENDLEGWYPLGIQTRCDLGYLFFEIFNKEFRDEIERRGYDISTMKFEICPKLPNEKRFKTLSEKYIDEVE